MKDKINPEHYKVGHPLETIKIIEHYDLGFKLGNVVKYVLRHKNKNGLEDLKKAQYYLNREIEKYENGLVDNKINTLPTVNTTYIHSNGTFTQEQKEQINRLI